MLFNIGIRNYPLIQLNMIIGTFGAYAITRTPPETMAEVGKPKGPVLGGAVLIFLAAICSFLVMPVRANDCTRDILNAQDCLRTDGFAEAISRRLFNAPVRSRQRANNSPDAHQCRPPGSAPDPADTASGATAAADPSAGTLQSKTPEEKAQAEEALRQMKEEKLRQEAEAAAEKAREQARQKMLDNLNKMQDQMVKRKEFTSDDFTRISDQMDKVRNQLYSKGNVDTDLIENLPCV